jgi:hypothetical protein
MYSWTPSLTLALGRVDGYAPLWPVYPRQWPVRLRLKCDGTRAETRFRLSAKRTSPFESAGASVQSTTGSRGLRISGSEVVWRVLATHSIRQFFLHFPSRASPCAITFQLVSTHCIGLWVVPRAGLEGCGKSHPHRNSIPGPSSP